jgi:hypothetical protein
VLAALIIGAFTAWHLGVRAGVVAAAVSAAALVLAAFVPGATITVYVLLGAWVAMLYFLGPRLSGMRPTAKPGEARPDLRAEATKWAMRARSAWQSRKEPRK